MSKYLHFTSLYDNTEMNVRVGVLNDTWEHVFDYLGRSTGETHVVTRRRFDPYFNGFIADVPGEAAGALPLYWKSFFPTHDYIPSPGQITTVSDGTNGISVTLTRRTRRTTPSGYKDSTFSLKITNRAGGTQHYPDVDYVYDYPTTGFDAPQAYFFIDTLGKLGMVYADNGWDNGESYPYNVPGATISIDATPAIFDGAELGLIEIDDGGDEGTPGADYGDPIDLPDISHLLGWQDTNMTSIFIPTSLQLKALADYLFADSIAEIIGQLFGNPADAILSLTALPFVASELRGTDLGKPVIPGLGQYLNNAPQMFLCNKDFLQVKFGPVSIPQSFGDFRDYEPFSHANLYIPFVGTVDLPLSRINNRKLSVAYNVDVSTSAATAFVIVHDTSNSQTIIASYPCNLGRQMVITSANMQDQIRDITTLIAGTNRGIYDSGSFFSGDFIANGTVKSSGCNSGSPAQMDVMYPYIRITRPVGWDVATNDYAKIIGQKCVKYGKVSDFAGTGYTKFSEVHLNGLSCDIDESREIEDYLINKGVRL